MPAESAIMFQNAAYFVLSILVMITLYLIFSPLLEGDKLKKRMTAVSTYRSNLKSDRMKSLDQASLKSGTKKSLIDIVNGLSLEKLMQATDLKDNLAQAGLRGEKPFYMFYLFRLAMPVGLGVMSLLFLPILNVMNWTLSQNLLGVIIAVAIGYYSPAIYLKQRANNRLASISPVFPDSLDLLLICVESGMSVEMAFARVAKEMAENSVELAEEFHITTAELSYLQNRRQAFENFARRNNHVGIRSVSTALIQSERYGTPLGATLRTLAEENRQMRMMAAEKKAAALPAKLTVPMILFFMPVLFIVILTPAVMRIGSAF